MSASDVVEPVIGLDAPSTLPIDSSPIYAPPSDVKYIEEKLAIISNEFSSYRRRSEVEVAAAFNNGQGDVVRELIWVLDDLDLASEHGEYSGGLKSVGDKLRHTLKKLGLVKFDVPGGIFDPTLHEAIMHEERSGVDPGTIWKVLRPGYLFNGKLLRCAQVIVADPEAMET